MSGYKAAFWVTAAALAVSVAWQVWRWRSAQTGQRRSPSMPAAVSATGPSPVSTEDGKSQVARLRAELAACRQTSWELVSKAIGGEQTAAAGALRGATATPPEGKVNADFDEQQHTLCRLAEAQLRRHLEAERTNLLGLLDLVGNEQWVEKDVRKKVAAHSKRFGLSARDADRLERGYRRLWDQHGTAMARLVEDEDWTALLVQAQSFWRDEDAMVASQLGSAARSRYRVDVLDSRTAIAAILATLAKLPWDDSIAW